MNRPSLLFSPVLAAALLASAAPSIALPLAIEGRVLDHRRVPVANYPVHIASPCPNRTVYTFSNGLFRAVEGFECAGYWHVSVGPYSGTYLVTDGTVNTGDWILPAPCRPPCEIAPPDDGGPFAVTPAGTSSGKPDELDPGDDDMPDGEGDDDTPNAHGSSGFALRIASRNPFRGSVSMRLTVPRDTRGLDGGVYDMAGRRVRGIAVPATAGTHLLQWNGRNDQGALVKAGLYFVRVQGDLGRAGTTVVLLP